MLLIPEIHMQVLKVALTFSRFGVRVKCSSPRRMKVNAAYNCTGSLLDKFRTCRKQFAVSW